MRVAEVGKKSEDESDRGEGGGENESEWGA